MLIDPEYGLRFLRALRAVGTAAAAWQSEAAAVIRQLSEELDDAWRERDDLAERLAAAESRRDTYHQLWQEEMRRPRGP